MLTDCTANDSFEINPWFRRIVEERIARLERDAEFDEAQVAMLSDSDHIRRQMRLVAAERAEALRMRIFLDRQNAVAPAADCTLDSDRLRRIEPQQPA
jgi:hypothetical protein